MECGDRVNRGVRSNKAGLLKSPGVRLQGNAPGRVRPVAGHQISMSLNAAVYNILEFR